MPDANRFRPAWGGAAICEGESPIRFDLGDFRLRVSFTHTKGTSHSLRSLPAASRTHPWTGSSMKVFWLVGRTRFRLAAAPASTFERGKRRRAPTHSLIGGSKFPVTKSEGKYSKPLNSPAFRRDQTEAKGSKMLQNGGFPCKFPVSAP
jgi:hypothetical protein